MTANVLNGRRLAWRTTRQRGSENAEFGGQHGRAQVRKGKEIYYEMICENANQQTVWFEVEEKETIWPQAMRQPRNASATIVSTMRAIRPQAQGLADCAYSRWWKFDLQH
jgi:hypothetical protein